MRRIQFGSWVREYRVSRTTGGRDSSQFVSILVACPTLAEGSEDEPEEDEPKPKKIKTKKTKPKEGEPYYVPPKGRYALGFTP